MALPPTIGEATRKLLEVHLRGELGKCKTAEERLGILAEYMTSMNPSDASYFAKLFASQPVGRPRDEEIPRKKADRKDITAFNLDQPAWTRAPKTTGEEYAEAIDKLAGHQRIKLRHLNKGWRRKTLVRNSLLSAEMRFYAPCTGGIRTLRRWFRWALMSWPVYGGSCPTDQFKMKVPPQELTRTATIEVVRFYSPDCDKPPAFFRVHLCYDKLLMTPMLVWSEYTPQAINEIRPPEALVSDCYNEDGEPIRRVEFPKTGGLK